MENLPIFGNIEPIIDPMIEPIIIGDLSGWVDESSGPGLSSGRTSIVSMPEHPNAFMLDSLSGANYYMEKAYYIDINNVDE